MQRNRRLHTEISCSVSEDQFRHVILASDAIFSSLLGLQTMLQFCYIIVNNLSYIYLDSGRGPADGEPRGVDAAAKPEHGELGGQPPRQKAGQQV